MVELTPKKVGIVACSGEELAEGTVTRLATLRVLEQLRPNETVTICLPLFLAGGEGDRAFARYYPTIAVDGCEKQCAAKATEIYSGKPSATLMVSEFVQENGLNKPMGSRHLNDNGLQVVEKISYHIADVVDRLLDAPSNRRTEEPKQTTCSCGSGIPVQEIQIDGSPVTLLALPLIFTKLHSDGKTPTEDNLTELFELIRIYNPIPNGSEEAYKSALLAEYKLFCMSK